MARRALALLAAAACAASMGSGIAVADPAPNNDTATSDTTAAQVRVNQQGYLPGETKEARLMAPRAVTGTFTVVDGDGQVAASGAIPAAPVGHWNAHYPDVYVLDFSALQASGRFRIVVDGDVTATSPEFRITTPDALYGELLRDGVAFDQVQRDGADVIAGPLHRRASHLRDRRATVYRWPKMEKDSDLILDRRMHALPQRSPVDVAGGWFDAGDYLKFTHSAAYADVLLFTSARLLGSSAPASLIAEARYGERWLDRMWDARRKTLHLQVGIGSGNRAGTFRGDHDLWRLPQADDRDTRHADRFVSHRPVFDAAAPGHQVSPNLAGRVSAAFALAAQADAVTHPRRARRELREATSLYGMAATRHPPHPLVTALPHAFYPESTWRDDMALGGAEIALAARKLHRPAATYVQQAAHWAHRYVAHPSGDTLNLYDTSALADAALARAMSSIHHGRLAVTRTALANHLRGQIRHGVRQSAADPFAASSVLTDFDADSHTFGLVASVGLYDRLTRTGAYQRFATSQRTWLLGGNPWGLSTMIGVGDRFPLCSQHQVANLSGTTDGTPPVLVGAVVNGPNGADNFEGGLGGFQDGMVHCSGRATELKAADGQGSRWVDDVRSWQTDEPALDMTGAAIIAAAAQLSLTRAGSSS